MKYIYSFKQKSLFQTKKHPPPTLGVFLFLNINRISIHTQEAITCIYGLIRINCTKLLSELMMKNGRSVKLNKKYFFTVLAAFAIQLVFGVNFANAICESEIDLYCKTQSSYDDCYSDAKQHPFNFAKDLSSLI